MAKQLYVIDGHWQIYRAYYARLQGPSDTAAAAAPRELTSPAGEPTRATHVFCTWLLKLIAERKPDYLVIAGDSPREALKRTQLYPEYKAQREAPPEDLPVQRERIFQIVRAMGIPLLARDGAEADDIMATIVRRLAGADLHVVMVSRDKDLEQLLGENVTLYDPVKDEMIGPAGLTEQKGYPPEKATEVQALCGDKVDNIPGVPGVGPKKAVQLIAKYGSARAVVEHADELTPKLAENVRKHADDVALARQLVTLDGDVEIELKLSDLAFRGVNAGAVRPIFRELGFRRLLGRLEDLGGGAATVPEEAAAPAAEAPGEGVTTAADFDYQCIDTPQALEALVKQLRGVTRLAVDTETTSTQPMWAELVGISLAWQPGRGVYLPLAGPLGAVTLDLRMVGEKLGPILADPKIEKIGQNLKYDLIVLGRAGFTLAGTMFDTMLAAYVLQADRSSFALTSLAAEMLNHRCIPIEDIIGTGRNQRTMNEVPVEEVVPYAAEDADVAFRLAGVLRERLSDEGLTELFERIEMGLMPVLASMEQEGIRVDPVELGRQKNELAKRADELRERIIAAAGRVFNVDSPKQLREVLFEELELPVIKRTKTGPSTDSSVLTELAALHEVPGLVLDYRQISKLLSTYLVALGRCIHPVTERVHTSFRQTGTATGRLSSSDPNLQNIPVRTELGRQIRVAFMAGEGKVLISADYSQVELRVLAHLCEDETLLAAFRADQDIHRIVAAEVFGVGAEQVTPDQRARAKTVNFGIIYGQTAFGLARTLRIARKAAGEFIASYKRRFPKIDQFLQACVAQAKQAGYVETLAGRRRRIDGFDSSNPQRRALAGRLAINSVVQGSAADLIKIAMINIHRRLAEEARPSRMLLQIHDELLFETPREAAEADGSIIAEEMTGAMQLRVPLKVDLGVGPNWRDAK